MAMTTLTAHHISPRDVLEQVMRDFLDKEVQAGYTYTYIWMANQFGHFTLGLFPTLLCAWVISLVPGLSPALIRALQLWLIPIAFAVLWAWKELRDVERAAQDAAGHPFPLNRGDLLRDAGTAVFFFWIGIIVAALSLRIPLAGAIAFGIGFVAAIAGPARYWLPRKLCFQRARLPYLARLADFSGEVLQREDTVAAVEAFLREAAIAASGAGPDANFEPRQPPVHLMIFGALNSGRTWLATAIGTEHTCAKGLVRYATWRRFQELAAHASPAAPADGVNTEDGVRVWRWPEVDIVILDDTTDMNSARNGDAIMELKKGLWSLPPDVRKVLARKHVVWVFADPSPTSAHRGLAELLAEALGMPLGCFRSIPITPPEIQPRKPRVAVASLSGL